MAFVTLGVIVLETNLRGDAAAHTMGLTTFSIMHLFYALETSNAQRTLFSSELIENPVLLRMAGLSVLTIFLATSFGPLQRLLETIDLTVEQWAVCIAGAATIIVIEEVRKFISRRRSAGPAPAVAAPAPVPA